MALPVLHTFSRNKSRDALQSGKGPDIRIHGLKGNMNKDQVWSTAKAACEGKPPRYRRHLGCILLKVPAISLPTGESCTDLFAFSSTCWYFGESLAEKLGAAAPPIVRRQLRTCLMRPLPRSYEYA